MNICVLTVNCCCKYSLFLPKVLLSTQAVYLEVTLLSPREERHFSKVKGVELIQMKKEEKHNGREHCVLEYYSIIKYMYSARTQLTLYKKITLESGLERLYTLAGTIILRYAVRSPVDCIVLWNTVM